MNRNIYILICTLVLTLHAQSQEREILTGVVTNRDSVLEDVHIRNITSGKFSISEKHGNFTINVRAGDTLLFSHIGYLEQIRILQTKELKAKILKIEMIPDDNQLEEIIIDDESAINAVNLGIIPKKVKKLSIDERRFKTAGDFKPIHLLGLLTGSIQLDPILNAINGRTKKLKQNIIIEKQMKDIAFLESNYSLYIQENLQVAPEKVPLFIEFLMEQQEFQLILNSRHDARIKFYLHDQMTNYQLDIDEQLHGSAID